ncbi:HAD-IIA family hydrolase [Arhodomonas sp. AD133]|uniref:HAD-IIA family hydrolase n=1 Tax=Arhodomonas sp. AD133 TaxID=3415009 RepID=UPI003EBF92E0
MTEQTDITTLLERYEAILLDAYGVLVTGAGALPGAAALIERLERDRRPWHVVTNAASSLPEQLAERFRQMGVPIPPHRVITSGSMIEHHFGASDLAGRRCAVLGPVASHEYVRRAGGDVVGVDEPFDVLCVCDEEGIDFLDMANRALTGVCQGLDAGRDVQLVLTNPDIIYPSGPGRFAFTAGALALLIEEALALRYPEPPRFTALGKPEPVIFREALRRTGAEAGNAVMIGDQRHTDILGAHRAGIASALVASGVAGDRTHDDLPAPTWLLSGLGEGD